MSADGFHPNDRYRVSLTTEELGYYPLHPRETIARSEGSRSAIHTKSLCRHLMLLPYRPFPESGNPRPYPVLFTKSDFVVNTGNVIGVVGVNVGLLAAFQGHSSPSAANAPLRSSD